MTSVESVDTSGSSTLILWHNPNVDVASVVNTVYPETQLFCEATTDDDEDLGEVHLLHGSSIQLASGHKITIEETYGETFKIIRSSSHLDILVPSYGRGFVGLSGHRRQQDNSHSVSTSSVKQLTINDDSKRNGWPTQCELLLRCVGDRLETLHGAAYGQNTEYLERVLTLASQAIDYSATGSQYFPLSESSLVAEPIRMEISDDSVTNLLEVLADPTTPAAPRLTTLDLNDGKSSPVLAALLVQIVLRNRGLEQICAYLSPDDQELYRQVLRLNVSDDDSDIDEDDEDGERRFFTIPLSMEPKCAFLSVVSASNKHQAPLNRDVLGLILAFGAKPSTRRAMICCTSDSVLLRNECINCKYVYPDLDNPSGGGASRNAIHHGLVAPWTRERCVVAHYSSMATPD